MTELLQQAFEKFAQLPDEQQDAIARVLLNMEYDYIDPNHGPIVSPEASIFEQLGITQEGVDAIAQELGVE